MKFFGWELRKENVDKELSSFTPEVKDDGALVVAAGGAYGTYVDLEGTTKTEAELVTRYREMSQTPEIENALDEITNEAIIYDEKYITRITLDKLKVPDTLKAKIEEEFLVIQKLLNFNKAAYEIFKRWYVDGRLYYHAIIDDKNPVFGLQELRYIDPRKIRKIREVKRTKKGDYEVIETVAEYYVYSDKGFAGNASGNQAPNWNAAQGIRISLDSILHITSGITDSNNQMVLSYLHKAIRPLNQLRVLEDATLIYRISRAPERRIFYIDVGQLPKAKAEQYVRDMMVRHKNRVVYDQTTGEVKDQRKFTTMLEDYWFPRRDGDKGTKIETLPAGQNLGKLEDVEYFQKKLYNSLQVPISRIETENSQFTLATELTRDEIKFSKFIDRLRLRFSNIFLDSLEKQLVLKGIVSKDEWENEIKDYIVFEYARDNYFAEVKESDIAAKRLTLLDQYMPYVGRYYSNAWVRKNVLKQDEEDVIEIDNEIHDEMDNEQYASTEMMPPDLTSPPPSASDKKPN